MLCIFQEFVCVMCSSELYGSQIIWTTLFLVPEWFSLLTFRWIEGFISSQEFFPCSRFRLPNKSSLSQIKNGWCGFKIKFRYRLADLPPLPRSLVRKTATNLKIYYLLHVALVKFDLVISTGGNLIILTWSIELNLPSVIWCKPS